MHQILANRLFDGVHALLLPQFEGNDKQYIVVRDADIMAALA